MLHHQKSDHRADDHRKICREGKVSDALSLACRREDECRKRRRRCRRHGEDDAVEQAESVKDRECRSKGECSHDEEEKDGDPDHEAPLIDRVDEDPRPRARSDRTDLEECHGEPRFHIAAAVLRHDDDGQRRDHGILRDVDEEIAQAQTEEFACPERLTPYTFHGTTFRFLMVRLRAVYVTIFQYTTENISCKGKRACFFIGDFGAASSPLGFHVFKEMV